MKRKQSLGRGECVHITVRRQAKDELDRMAGTFGVSITELATACVLKELKRREQVFLGMEG